MRHTFAFIALTALLIFTSWYMLVDWNNELTTESAPYGMLSYELAGGQDDDNAQANAILQEWAATNMGPSYSLRDLALFSLGFDYLYMFVYTGWLIFAMWLLRGRRSNEHFAGSYKTGEKRVSVGLAITMVLTAFIVPADAIENIFLIIQVLKNVALDDYAHTAFVASVIKFGLIAFALVALLILGLKRATEKSIDVNEHT